MISADLAYLGRRLDAALGAGHKGAHAEVTRFDASRFVTGTYLLLGDSRRVSAHEAMSPGEQSSSCRASSLWHSPCERSCLGAGGGPTLLTPWPAGSLRLHPEARGDERRTPALRSLARPRRAPRAHRTRSSEGRRRTTRAARAVAAGCRASGALAPSTGVYDRPRPPLIGGSGGADRSARSASLRASRP